MKRIAIGLGVFTVLVLAAPAGAELCEKCKGRAYIMSVGKCVECGGFAGSGAFKLCKKCSARLGQCEHCRAPLKAPKPPADEKPAALAAKYPGDEGIGKDPAVILHDDFEAAEIDKAKWPEISNKGGAIKLTREPDNVSGGRQSLQVTATLGLNTGGHLFRRFEKGYERMYARFYVKFAPDCDYIHHFVHMAAELPAYRWPTGGAGLKPDGDKKFTVGIEPWGRWGKYPPPGGWHFYCYWWKMPKSGDGKYWGADFAKEAYAVPQRGKWYCVEFMTRCNTPGKDDGEAALWIDGKQMSHHKDINWRSDEKLKLNAFWLMLYVTEHSARTNKVNTVWFDDVVVASEYIGPRAEKKDTATKPGGEPNEVLFGRARIAIGMTKEEVLEQIRLSREQYEPLEDKDSTEMYVRLPSDDMIRSDTWSLTCPTRNSHVLGGGSGAMLGVKFRDGKVVRLSRGPWLAG